MRRGQLHEYVSGLVNDTWTGSDGDVAATVLADEAFGALAHRLGEVGDDQVGVAAVWGRLVASLSDSQLDWLVDNADNPAAWLASRLAEQS